MRKVYAKPSVTTRPVSVSGGSTKEHRRSRRVLASVPLEIQWGGKCQMALTAVINLHGVLILSSVNCPSGTTLTIKNQKTGREVGVRVVWSGNEESKTGGYKLGVEFQASYPEFWAEDYNSAEGIEAL
jgi:hypothetical protein